MIIIKLTTKIGHKQTSALFIKRMNCEPSFMYFLLLCSSTSFFFKILKTVKYRVQPNCRFKAQLGFPTQTPWTSKPLSFCSCMGAFNVRDTRPAHRRFNVTNLRSVWWPFIVSALCFCCAPPWLLPNPWKTSSTLKLYKAHGSRRACLEPAWML